MVMALFNDHDPQFELRISECTAPHGGGDSCLSGRVRGAGSERAPIERFVEIAPQSPASGLDNREIRDQTSTSDAVGWAPDARSFAHSRPT
jgi:hypothetical protein